MASKATPAAIINGDIFVPGSRQQHWDIIKNALHLNDITDPAFWTMLTVNCTLIKDEHPEYKPWKDLLGSYAGASSHDVGYSWNVPGDW